MLIPERLNRQQRIHLAVPDTLGRECDRRLHRDQRQQLHQVVLDHVAQCAGTFVVRGTALDTDRLRRRDLHVIDVPPVPDRLEHAVRETEHHQVLDGLLPEVVIDPEDLFLVEVAMDEAVQRRGRCAGRVPNGFSMMIRRQPAPPALASPAAPSCSITLG